MLVDFDPVELFLFISFVLSAFVLVVRALKSGCPAASIPAIFECKKYPNIIQRMRRQNARRVGS